MLFIVPEGTILGPLLLVIFRCDLLFIMSETDFASHADDSKFFRTANAVDEYIYSLEHDFMMFLK